MTMKHTFRAATLAVAALFTQATPASAAYQTGVYYDQLAAYYSAGEAYNKWFAESGRSYNAVKGSSLPAANACFYRCELNAFEKYYNFLAEYYYNYYVYQAYSDIGNVAAYVAAAKESQEVYQGVAYDYSYAYGNATSPSYHGGDFGDWTAYYNRFATIIYDISSSIRINVGSRFAGSYYQYAMIYGGVGEGLQGYYSDLAYNYYYYFADIGNFTSANSYFSFYNNYAYEASGPYYWTARYYRDFAIAYE